jgi:hypothetical protein
MGSEAEIAHLDVLVRWTSPSRDRFRRRSQTSGLDGESNDPQLNAAAHERPF